jgi:hypothetical protein
MPAAPSTVWIAIVFPVCAVACGSPPEDAPAAETERSAQVDISPEHDCPEGGGSNPRPRPTAGALMNTCFVKCTAERPDVESVCGHQGYMPPPRAGSCLVRSVHEAWLCAGTGELCEELNLLPDGSPATPEGVCDPPSNNSERIYCGLKLYECQEAWLDHAYELPYGRVRSMRSDCQQVAIARDDECRRRCMTLYYRSGIRCEAGPVEGEGGDGEYVEQGNLDDNGVCCNQAETRCRNCLVSRYVSCGFWE